MIDIGNKQDGSLLHAVHDALDGIKAAHQPLQKRLQCLQLPCFLALIAIVVRLSAWHYCQKQRELRTLPHWLCRIVGDASSLWRYVLHTGRR